MEEAKMELTMCCPTLFGLEGIVADELRFGGRLTDVRAENGRVLCQGSWADCARLNINLRCGARVIALLGQFPARSFEELFQGVRAIPWEEFLPREAAFPVKGYSISSQLHSVPACQSIIKKAVVERLKAHYGMEQFPETGTKTRYAFLCSRIRCPSAWMPVARGCTSGATAPWVWRHPCGRRWRRHW